MKKHRVIIILAIAIVFILTMCSCKTNKTPIIDYYYYNRAIICLPSGDVINVNIEKWSTTDNGKQIIIKDTKGVTYMVSINNCVLISDSNNKIILLDNR